MDTKFSDFTAVYLDDIISWAQNLVSEWPLKVTQGNDNGVRQYSVCDFSLLYSTHVSLAMCPRYVVRSNKMWLDKELRDYVTVADR